MTIYELVGYREGMGLLGLIGLLSQIGQVEGMMADSTVSVEGRSRGGLEYVLTIHAAYAESGSRCAGNPVRAAATQAFPVTLAKNPRYSYPVSIVDFLFSAAGAGFGARGDGT